MVNVQTGPASGLGKGMRAGAEAVFLNQVNAKGGVHGRKMELFGVGDDGYEPDRAVDETLKMMEKQKVFSLFGYVGTPTGNAVLPIVKEMDVPLVGLLTGAMTLRQPVTKQVFNVRASYDDEAETLVARLRPRAPSRWRCSPGRRLRPGRAVGHRQGAEEAQPVHPRQGAASSATRWR